MSTIKIIKGSDKQLEYIYSHHYVYDFDILERKELNHIRELVQNPNYEFLLAIDDELNDDTFNIIGYTFMLRIPSEKSALLDIIAVCKDYRNDGYGSIIFQSLSSYQFKNGCDGMFLEVEIPKPKSLEYNFQIRRIKFYERLGCKHLDIPYILPNLEGGLEMYLMYKSFYDTETTKIELSRSRIINVIQTCYDQISFDVEHRNKIFDKFIGKIKESYSI